MKTKLLKLFLGLSFMMISACSYGEVSNGFNFRVWSVEWDANSDYLKVDDDYLYSLGYSLALESWTVSLTYSTGTFDGENMMYNPTGWASVERKRNEYEAYLLKSFQVGPGSLGVGAGYRYMTFNVDFDNYSFDQDITIHGPAVAVSYSQPVDKEGNFVLNASGTLMPYLFEKVDYSGPWYLGSYYAPNGADENDATWGWNAQVSGTYVLNNWLFTLGYKYQTIKEKEMDFLIFEEETFSGLFAEVKFAF